MDGARVDWIYRNVDRVQQAWEDAQAGQFSFHRQPGHQLGVPDFAYVGEVALGVVIADRTGEVTALHDAATAYPFALTTTLVDALWEPTFELVGANKATARGDTVYIAGVIVHALNVAPADFAARCHGVLATLGTDPDELAAALHVAQIIVDDVRTACRFDPR